MSDMLNCYKLLVFVNLIDGAIVADSNPKSSFSIPHFFTIVRAGISGEALYSFEDARNKLPI